MAQAPAAVWLPVGDALCASPQAPFWSALEERLYWLDVPMRRAWRVHLPSQQAEHWSLSGPSTGLVPCRSGGFLLLLADGIYHAGAWRDVPALLAPWPATHAPGFWQAGACDPWGRLWLTGPSPQGHAPTASNSVALYCLRPRSAKMPLLAWVRNGMGDGLSLSWASNGQRLYWCNPRNGEVMQAALSQPGQWPPELGLPMPWARFALRPPEPGASVATAMPFVGLPRALALDQHEHGWLALHGTGHLMRIDGQGQPSTQGKVPALCPTGLCLGGLDGRTLFVTTARAGRSAAELERFPLSGAVFAASVDSPGATPTVYWD